MNHRSLIFIISMLFVRSSFGAQCFHEDLARALKKIKTEVSKNEVAQCMQQELIEPITDPVIITELVLQNCQKNERCAEDFRSKMRAKYPELKISDSSMPIYLWSQNIKYSGYFRRAQIQLSDLLSAEESFAQHEIYKQQLANEKSLNKSEKKALICMLGAGIVGPGKINVVKGAKEAIALSKVVRRFIVDTGKVDKLFAKNKFPKLVVEKFNKWKKEIEEKGLEEVRKSPGFHDEPVKSSGGKLRSVRLNDGYRIYYETVENSDGVVNLIIKDINMHLY